MILTNLFYRVCNTYVVRSAAARAILLFRKGGPWDPTTNRTGRRAVTCLRLCHRPFALQTPGQNLSACFSTRCYYLSFPFKGKDTHCGGRRCATGALRKRDVLPRIRAEGCRCHGFVVGAACATDLRSPRLAAFDGKRRNHGKLAEDPLKSESTWHGLLRSASPCPCIDGAGDLLRATLGRRLSGDKRIHRRRGCGTDGAPPFRDVWQPTRSIIERVTAAW